MSLQSERIQLLMQRLSLTEMAHGYEALAEQAAQKNLPYCDFLEQVLESEANVRQERNIKVRTQLAGFPDLKRLEPRLRVRSGSSTSNSPPRLTRRRSANWRVCVFWSVTRTPCSSVLPGLARLTWRSR
jgi:hypothetical protein